MRKKSAQKSYIRIKITFFLLKNLVNPKKSITFAPALRTDIRANGTLDERFSPRSAKPVSAVRLRKVPHVSRLMAAFLIPLPYG